MNPDKKIVNLLSCARSEQFEVSPDGEITSKAQKEKKGARKKIPSVEVVRKMKRSGKKQCSCESGRTITNAGDKNDGDVNEKNAARIIITAGDDAKVSLNLILREEIVEEGKEGEIVDDKAHLLFEESQVSGIVAGGDNTIPCGRPQCPRTLAGAPPPPPPPCGRPVCPQITAVVSPCARPDCPQKTVTPICVSPPVCSQVAQLLQQQASDAAYLQSIASMPSDRSRASEIVIEPTSTLCYQTSEIRADGVPVVRGHICPTPSSCARRGHPSRSDDKREMSAHYSESSYRTAHEMGTETDGFRRAMESVPDGPEMYNVEIAPSVKTVGSTGLSRSAGVVVEAESKESIQSALAPQVSVQNVKVCAATCSGVKSGGLHLGVPKQGSSQESNLSTEIVEAESAGEGESKTQVGVNASRESYRAADAPYDTKTALDNRKSCNKNSCIFRVGGVSEPMEKSSGTSYKTAGSAAGISRSLSKHSSSTFRKTLDASIKSSGASYKTVDGETVSQKSAFRKHFVSGSDRMGSNRGSGTSQRRDSVSAVGSYRSANVLGATESAASKGSRGLDKDGGFYKGSEKSLRTDAGAQDARSIQQSSRASLGQRSVEVRASRLSEAGSRYSRSSYIPEDREAAADEPEEAGASGSGGGAGGGGGGEDTGETEGESGHCRLLILILLLLLMLPFLMLFGAFMALAICRPLPCFHYYFGQSLLGSIFVGKSHESLRAVF